MDEDIDRWNWEGGFCPPDDDEPDWGESPLRAYYGWYLTYAMLRRMFL